MEVFVVLFIYFCQSELEPIDLMEGNLLHRGGHEGYSPTLFLYQSMKSSKVVLHDFEINLVFIGYDLLVEVIHLEIFRS